jgi:hypothetical protein
VRRPHAPSVAALAMAPHSVICFAIAACTNLLAAESTDVPQTLLVKRTWKVDEGGESCTRQQDCPAQQYCDSTSSCYACSYLADPKAECDALGGDCCSAAFLRQCPSNPEECQGNTCTDALQTLCGTKRLDLFACAQCAGRHSQLLHAAGCTNDAIAAWCASRPTHFPGSRILLNNVTWGTDVNDWAGRAATQVWKLCYSSLTDNRTTLTFHEQCDRFNTTMTFARNSLGFVFGGYAVRSWNGSACCAISANTCEAPPATNCIDRTAASNFIFRLQPDQPQRFMPLGFGGDDGTRFQNPGPTYWPSWGYNDLIMGGLGGPPGGTYGYCLQGRTYEGVYDEACGGTHNWGPTDLEVWYVQ